MANDIVTVYALIRDGDKILLQQRQNTGFGDGSYSLIGGHVDEGESARDALIREMKEEIGLCVSSEDMKFACFLHRNTPKGTYLNLFFEVRKWEGTPKICEPHKASDLNFFPAKNLPSNILDYIRYAVDCAERGLLEGYLGWSPPSSTAEVSGTPAKTVAQKLGSTSSGSSNGGPA